MGYDQLWFPTDELEDPYKDWTRTVLQFKAASKLKVRLRARK